VCRTAARYRCHALWQGTPNGLRQPTKHG
jgi:hypothetical protein